MKVIHTKNRIFFPEKPTLITLSISLLAIVFSPSSYSDFSDKNKEINSLPLYERGYIGIRGGYSYNQKSCLETALSCDKDGFGYGIYAGYQFNKMLSFEISHNDMADTTAEYPSITLDGKLEETNLSVLLSHPLTQNSSAFIKAGASYWQGKSVGDGVYIKGSGYRPLLGAGYEFFPTGKLSSRLEYQYINKIGNGTIGFANPHFVSLSLQWNFGRKGKSRHYAEPPVVQEEVFDESSHDMNGHHEPKVTIITMDESVGGPLFDSGSHKIKSTSAVDEVIRIMANNPPLHVTIIGHTDSDGSASYNQNLSRSRANTVAKYMMSKGIGSDRIKIFGMGEDQPVADNSTPEGKAKNRRVEFHIYGNIEKSLDIDE